jgi:hypothetical protein
MKLYLIGETNMKSAFSSLLLLLTVAQVTHGAINTHSEDLTLQSNQEKFFSPLNQNKNNDDEDESPLVPTY